MWKTQLFKAEMIPLGKHKVRIAESVNSVSFKRKIEITGCKSMRLKLCKTRFVFVSKVQHSVFPIQ